MTTPKQKKQPKTSREVLHYARKRGATFEEGKKHTKVYGSIPGRPVSVPRHSGDIPTGTLGSIMSGLRAIGLLMLVLSVPVCLTIWLVAGLSGMY